MGVDTNANCTGFAGCIWTAGMEFAVRYNPQRALGQTTRQPCSGLRHGGLRDNTAIYFGIDFEVEFGDIKWRITTCRTMLLHTGQHGPRQSGTNHLRIAQR